MIEDKLAIPEALQKHWALHGVKMKRRIKYKGQDVFLADGGPHYDAKDSKSLSKDDEWMREGYYVSTWAVQKGKLVLGFPLYFKFNHDLNLGSKDARSEARLNSALYSAKEAIDAMISVGQLEHTSDGGIILNG